MAKAIAGLPSHKQREIIQFSRKFPNSSLGNFKEKVLVNEPRPQKIYVTILPLREDIYNLLKERATKSKVSVEKMILNIVEQWIKKEESNS